MLQVARLAPQQLGESRDLVARFLHSRLTADGGFQDRAGESDLYYTVFGLEGLVALQEPLPAEAVASYLKRFGDGEGLAFVHLACLARCWANVSRDLAAVPSRAILTRLEEHRTGDGGYAQATDAAHGNVYAGFLALCAYEDLRVPVPDPDRLLDSLGGLRARDGGYANRPGDAHGITTVTAAAVSLLRTLDGPTDPHLGMWLLDRCHRSGGFVATPAAPVPDLLSTATALHALAALHVPMAGVYEPCLDFVDSLWTNRGGFFGSWVDDTLDCEYTYYGLLALGHLTAAAPA
jgi:geranylgeranyl transferase type-2 subunit beta